MSNDAYLWQAVERVMREATTEEEIDRVLTSPLMLYPDDSIQGSLAKVCLLLAKRIIRKQ